MGVGQKAHAQKTTQEKKTEEVRSRTTTTTESLARVSGRARQSDPLGVASEARLDGLRSLSPTALYCIFNSRITSFYYQKLPHFFSYFISQLSLHSILNANRLIYP